MYQFWLTNYLFLDVILQVFQIKNEEIIEKNKEIIEEMRYS